MRSDALGLFWQDIPKIKKPKAEVEKCVPPEPVWTYPDYLPYLCESIRFNVPLMTDMELIEAQNKGHVLVFDIECYINYFLIAFKNMTTGKSIYFEKWKCYNLDYAKLSWVMHNFTIVSFNGNYYDMPIAALALAGKTESQLKAATNMIINENYRGYQVLKKAKVKSLKCDHIDIMEVAPQSGSLKIYGGRAGSHRMQDLPFHHASELTPLQIAIVRYYCINDLDVTHLLYDTLKEERELRDHMSEEYGVDLRSKSDAQIAEAVIAKRIEELTCMRPAKPKIDPGTSYRYNVQSYMKFQTPLMQGVIERIRNTWFTVGMDGSIDLPKEIRGLKLTIGESTYKLGIGGLHSTEKKTSHFSDDYYLLEDVDVESYYPRIIINQFIFPKHLGSVFVKVFDTIVEVRLTAKHSGDKKVADSLKIVINGTFGKLGSKWSIFYSPDLLIQVTLTGQLSLLLLIETLELNGIPVVSANTDGIVIKCPRHKLDLRNQILDWWQKETQFVLDGNVYEALCSKDVNNYFAVKQQRKKDGSVDIKAKGVYADPGLRKNPTAVVCSEAVRKFVSQKIPIETTINEETNLLKFLSVRKVKSGAVALTTSTEGEKEVLDSEFLGEAIRWYYATEPENQKYRMVVAKNGNKVPKSDQARPLMTLPDAFPEDLNKEWYVNESYRILKDIGYEL